MRLEIVLIKQGAPPHDASSYTVLRQPISYFCLMKSPRPSMAEKAAGKGVFGLSGRIL